jgi:hypothetical protein
LPVLFTIDNAPSHAAVRAIEACAKANINVLALPPHVTHLLQPIDASWARSFESLFSELFRCWNEERLRLTFDVGRSMSSGRAAPAGEERHVDGVRREVGNEDFDVRRGVRGMRPRPVRRIEDP